MSRIFYNNHPLVQHKITQLRSVEYKKVEFSRISKEIGALMAYELTQDLETHDIEVQTPLEKTMAPEITGIKPCIVAILRAGIGIQRGILEVIPEAKEGYIDMSRNEDTLEPSTYRASLPGKLCKRRIYVAELMLATGGTSVEAIQQIKNQGGFGGRIKFVCAIAAPEGVAKLSEAHPDVDVYVGHLDRELNENGYILPGLGDAGDRLCGTLG